MLEISQLVPREDVANGNIGSRSRDGSFGTTNPKQEYNVRFVRLNSSYLSIFLSSYFLLEISLVVHYPRMAVETLKMVDNIAVSLRKTS